MISSIRSPASRVLRRSRIIASSPTREPDEHVEVLGALAARRGGQQPAVGDARRSGPARAPGGRRWRGWRSAAPRRRPAGARGSPAGRPGWRSSTLLAAQHDAGAVAERAVEARGSARRSAAVVERRARSTLGASGGSPRPGAPRVSSSRHWPSSRPSATTSARSRGVVAARCASARPVVIVLPVPTWRGVDAGADDLQRGDLAAGGRAAPGRRRAAGRAIMRTTWRGAGVERDVRARALERAQLGDRLLGDDAARGGAERRRRW